MPTLRPFGFSLYTGLIALASVVLLSRQDFSGLDVGGLVGWTVLALLASQSSVLLKSSVVDTSSLVTFAAICSFQRDVILGAAVVGMAGAIDWRQIRSGGLSPALFNIALYSLVSIVAAEALLTSREHGAPAAAAMVAMVVTWAAGDFLLLVPGIMIRHRQTGRQAASGLIPAFPSIVAFGLLGGIVGQLFGSLGFLAFGLLAVPMLVGRSAFKGIIQLQEAQESTLKVFLKAIHAKDEYTGRHTMRVAKYSLYMGEWMNYSPTRIEQLRRAALMHDIGKLATPTNLLNKPGKLTEVEFAIVRQHNHICIDILNQVDFLKPMIETAADKYGHYSDATDAKRMDAYIVAVADAFDAMTSTRSYRKALDMDVAFTELLDKSGTQFHPDAVESLIASIETRGERFGLGHEEDAVEFDVPPPVVGVGSAGLGDLATESNTGTPFESGHPEKYISGTRLS